jgi:hypothetical protein
MVVVRIDATARKSTASSRGAFAAVRRGGVRGGTADGRVFIPVGAEIG